MDEPSQAAQSAIEISPVTPLPEEGKSMVLESNGDSTSAAETGLSSYEDEDGEEENTLERASELFDKGSKAIEDGDFVEAVDSLSRALEIRVANYGDLAPECAISYYKYGCALLYKAQDETDPLGNVLKNSPKYSTEDTAVNNVEVSRSSTLSSALNKHASSPDINDLERGSGDKNEEEEIDGCKEDEELGEAEEEDSDLDLAWKMLDIARAIYERSSENSFEKVNVFAALGEVSMEREDLETSLSDFRRALAILEHLVEPDSRRVVELNFRICLALELGSKFEEAITYCEKAISLCKSRLERFKIASAKSKDSEETNEKSPNKLDKTAHELSSEPSILDGEIDVLSGISTDLEKKLEDLQQLMANPKSILSDLLKRTFSESPAAEKNAVYDSSRSLSINSSQMAALETGGFDSSTVSTAANDGVTHLGVVGRGIKRAVVASTDEVSSSPKKPFKLPAENEENCNSEVGSTSPSSRSSIK